MSINDNIIDKIFEDIYIYEFAARRYLFVADDNNAWSMECIKTIDYGRFKSSFYRKHFPGIKTTVDVGFPPDTRFRLILRNYIETRKFNPKVALTDNFSKDDHVMWKQIIEPRNQKLIGDLEEYIRMCFKRRVDGDEFLRRLKSHEDVILSGTCIPLRNLFSPSGPVGRISGELETIICTKKQYPIVLIDTCTQSKKHMRDLEKNIQRARDLQFTQQVIVFDGWIGRPGTLELNKHPFPNYSSTFPDYLAGNQFARLFYDKDISRIARQREPIRYIPDLPGFRRCDNPEVCKQMWNYYISSDLYFSNLTDLCAYHEKCVRCDDDKQWPNIECARNVAEKSNCQTGKEFLRLIKRLSAVKDQYQRIQLKLRDPDIPGLSSFVIA